MQLGSPTPKQQPETLTHAVQRMRQQGFSDTQIAEQVQKWHPGWNPAQITRRTGILTGGPAAQPAVQDEPPNPVLQKHGFIGGVQQFNQRVQAVVDSYKSAYGTPPPPGVVFDLARSKVDSGMFGHMFAVPNNPVAAQARAVATQHGYDPSEPLVLNAKQLASGITKAAFQGNYQQYVDQNRDLIHQLSYENKQDAATIAGALFHARRYATQKELAQQVADGKISDFEATNQLRASGFLPDGSGAVVHGVFGVVARGIGQVADSLVHSPAGTYELGKAVGLDVRDQVVNFGSPHPYQGGASSHPRTEAIAKAAVKQTVQDVQHPLRNPGYLFLDALGIATPVAGGVARIGEAGRVLRAGEGASAAARALATKPLRRATVRYGDFSEEMPLSQNPIVAKAQEALINHRVAKADKLLAGEGTPGGLRSILIPQWANDLLDNQLSLPKKVGREADARKRTDFIVKNTLSRELDAVAGRSVMQARMLSRVPEKIRGGLTRGEQKAIQVLSWDDPNPLEAEAAFHQRMIDLGVGDPKAHKRQVADLKLARQALENPSPRFKKALALTRQVVSEMERQKIEELGLLPETAEGRVAKAGAVLREDGVVPREPVTDESFYLPTLRRGKSKRQPTAHPGYYATKAGPFGVPLPRDMPELTHEFTGKALMAGDYRIDATTLASEAYARTVRAVTVRAEHTKLWAAAHDTPRSQFDIPIRDTQMIPDKLREVVARIDEGDFTQKEADLLPDDMRELLQELYPDPRKLTNETIQHVKWIDGRLLGEGKGMPHIPGTGAQVAQTIQAPFRFAALYLRPAYILNKLGNHAMLWLDQGIHTPPNFVRALAGKSLYGEENMRTIYELVGAGKSMSFVASKSGKASTAVAEFWNRVADRDERAAAFIHYMRLKGYKTQEDVTRLLNDKVSRADLNEIKRRANKSLVEFDNLLPIEKNYIRHWIFVYPWVSRSAVWSIRAILEHPTKIDALSHLGREDIQDDPIFKAAPAWFKRTGYVPIGWNHDGTPRVVNPTSINTFSTLGDFVGLAKAATVGDKYSSAEDFLGPLPKYFVHAASGRDEFGNQYPGSQWWDAAKEVLVGLPQVSAYDKAHPKQKKAGTSYKIGDRGSLQASLNSNLKKTVLSPGWLNGYGSLLAGGLSPRDVNLPALAARYWADQDPQTRHQRELGLLNRALAVQAEAMGTAVPAKVKAAVADQTNLEFKYKQFLKDTGRAPTDKERALFTVDYLREQGLIDQKTATAAKDTLNASSDQAEVNRVKNALLDRYAGGRELRQWDTDVRTVASFTPQVFNEKVARLFQQGLADQKRYQVSQQKLYEYGRKYVAFTHEVERLRKQGASSVQLKAFQDAHDKPVDGLPSFVRIAWANQTAPEQQHHVSSIATKSWATLAAFDKTLLGRPTDAAITQGWANFEKYRKQQETEAHRQGITIPRSYWRQIAQYIEKNDGIPGFVKDYDFSKLPNWERLKMLTPVQKSPNHALWVQLLNRAGAQSSYLHATDQNGHHLYKVEEVRQQWKDYIESPAVQSFLDQHPEFKAEVQSFGKNTLENLIG